MHDSWHQSGGLLNPNDAHRNAQIERKKELIYVPASYFPREWGKLCLAVKHFAW